TGDDADILKEGRKLVEHYKVDHHLHKRDLRDKIYLDHVADSNCDRVPDQLSQRHGELARGELLAALIRGPDAGDRVHHDQADHRDDSLLDGGKEYTC